ncbi:LamG-like jellyroll fold domain-containing protein [Aeoliella sp. SH292]|uniref:LamG-like jellyroll fold domain-containing protein n=1 Tax=Aeoliella sp. SH292 TaxID=3454464 RepID=UPI003F990D2B
MSRFQLVLSTAVAVAALLSISAKAALVHQYAFSENGGRVAYDSVGTAHLTVNGNASISGGRLVLPGSVGNGGTTSLRTNNAYAVDGSLTELASTINGASQLTIAAKFTMNTQSNWSKLFMAGQGNTHSYLDLTPRRGANGNVGSVSLKNGNTAEQTAIGTAVLATGTEYWMIGVWDVTNNSLTSYLSIDGDANSLTVGTDPNGLEGRTLAGITIGEFYLGSAVGYGDADLNGSIDLFQIYDHALSFDQITSVVNTGQIPEPASYLILGGLGLAIVAMRRRLG